MDYAYHQTPSHYVYNISESTKEQAYNYMDQLDGWCSKKKAAILMDIIFLNQPQTIVEIGVFGGKSLIPMACALKANGRGKIYGIDPWDCDESAHGLIDKSFKDWWSSVNHIKVLRNLLGKIDQFQLQDQIELYIQTSEEALPISGIDILHIDGNHSEDASYHDVRKWVPLMNPNGWVIFDDMSWSENGIVTTARAVEWLNKHCIKITEYNEDALWGIWVKK